MGLKKVFGKARDFYRVRVIALLEEIPSEFEWRDDILFSYPEYEGKSIREYRLEIVDIDSGKGYVLRSYKNREKVERRRQKIEEDLDELTKMQFEKKYKFFSTENRNVPRNLS